MDHRHLPAAEITATTTTLIAIKPVTSEKSYKVVVDHNLEGQARGGVIRLHEGVPPQGVGSAGVVDEHSKVVSKSQSRKVARLVWARFQAVLIRGTIRPPFLVPEVVPAQQRANGVEAVWAVLQV